MVFVDGAYSNLGTQQHWAMKQHTFSSLVTIARLVERGGGACAALLFTVSIAFYACSRSIVARLRSMAWNQFRSMLAFLPLKAWKNLIELRFKELFADLAWKMKNVRSSCAMARSLILVGDLPEVVQDGELVSDGVVFGEGRKKKDWLELDWLELDQYQVVGEGLNSNFRLSCRVRADDEMRLEVIVNRLRQKRINWKRKWGAESWEVDEYDSERCEFVASWSTEGIESEDDKNCLTNISEAHVLKSLKSSIRGLVNTSSRSDYQNNFHVTT